MRATTAEGSWASSRVQMQSHPLRRENRMTEAEIEEFNTKRKAIQSTATWEFEMWRRQTQAQWEIEQQDREIAYRKQLEDQLREQKEKQENSEVKLQVAAKQKQLRDLLVKCNHEARVLEKLKMETAEQQEKA